MTSAGGTAVEDNVEASRTMAARSGTRRGGSGSAVVLGIVALAAACGGFAVWFQRAQTGRCLTFYGPDVARRIQASPRVELWSLASDGPGGRPRAVDRRDVSSAPGLVHLRHGLVEDANFAWERPSPRDPPARWSVAFAFFDEGRVDPAAVLAFDLGEAASLTVVGRPGRVLLGHLADGLRRWLRAEGPPGASAPEAG